jgi:hypothetical protein
LAFLVDLFIVPCRKRNYFTRRKRKKNNLKAKNRGRFLWGFGAGGWIRMLEFGWSGQQQQQSASMAILRAEWN